MLVSFVGCHQSYIRIIHYFTHDSLRVVFLFLENFVVREMIISEVKVVTLCCAIGSYRKNSIGKMRKYIQFSIIYIKILSQTMKNLAFGIYW